MAGVHHTSEETLQGLLPTVGLENTLDSTGELLPAFTSKGLHCLHLNVHCLLPKIDEILVLANKSNASILCLTETWLDSSIREAEVEIENDIIIRKDRNRQRGGVCACVRVDIGFNVRTDLSNDNLEAVWISILFLKSKPNLFGALYRPPSQRNFVETLENVYASCQDFLSCKVILLSDADINIE